VTGLFRQQVGGQQLFIRHAKREGRSVARLRALDFGDSCVVEAEIFTSHGEATHAGPYTFADARQATAFVTEAVESLMYLGCDVYAE
jgi:2-keto-4-pentenoate hydratase